MDNLGTFPFKVLEAKSDTGIIEGYASVFNVVDNQNDVIVKGAFRRTIDALKRSGRRLPLTANHEIGAHGVIGSADVLEEDSLGLYARFRFSSDPDAQKLRTKAREGHLTGLSIFGDAVRRGNRTIAGGLRSTIEEAKLLAVGLTPWPVNELAHGVAKSADATITKAVTDRPWDGSASRFTPEQWRRATLIDTGEGDADSKSRYKLPVREPDGTINRNGAHAAAAAFAGGRGGEDASTEKKRSAARALVRIYRSDLDEDPPESLLRTAGMSVASIDFDQFTQSMRKALDIDHPAAMKAAVHELLGSYRLEQPAPEPDGLTAADPVAKSDTSEPLQTDAAAQYALSIIGESGPPSAPGGDSSPSSLAESLTVPVDVAKTTTELDLLEQQVKEALGHE